MARAEQRSSSHNAPNMPTPAASLAGQVALVTGASSGIGEACAAELACHGCGLILWARRADRLAALAARLAEAHPGLPVHTAAVDVTDSAAVDAALAATPPPLTPVSILVNNAGLALGVDPGHALAMADLDAMLAVNVRALVYLTRQLTPGMVARDAGHVINISSVAGHTAYGGGAGYCGTKHFVRAFTDALRCDLVATNVRVSSISPGAVRTEFSLVRFKGDEARADSVYAGFDELTAADCADAVGWIATRPAHVQVGDIVLWATRQAGPQLYGRRE